MKKNLIYAVAAVAFIFSEASEAGFLRKNAEKSEEIKLENREAGDPANSSPNDSTIPNADLNDSTVPDDHHINSGENAAPAVSSNPEVSSAITAPDSSAQGAQTAVKAPDPESKKNVINDPVVLKIGNKEFHRSQIMEDAKMLPHQMLQSIPPEKLFTMLQEQKIRNYLLIEHVKKLGLESLREYREELERAREGLLVRLYILRNIAPKAEYEPTLKARYAKYRAEYKSMKEYHLLHIMVSSEDAAKNIINELNNGKDFAALAKEKSEAPTKEAGGDGGFVPIEILPPEIKSKVSPLKVGEYTKEAVKLENGFNIFKVTEIRDSKPMSFEESGDMLRQMILRDEMTKVLNDLEKKADVKRFNEDGSPIAGK